MKKLFILILNTLIVITSATISVSASTPTEAGLYCTQNPQYEEDYDLQNDIHLTAGNNNDVIFVYYDGENYTNVSADVVITSSTYFSSEKIESEYKNSSKQMVKFNAVRFVVNAIGECNASVSYTVPNSEPTVTYKIENIKTDYPNMFAISKGVNPTTNLDEIITNIDTSVNEVLYLDLYYLNVNTPTKYLSTNSFGIYKFDNDQTSDIATIEYDNTEDSFKLTAVKEGSNCYISTSSGGSDRLSLYVGEERFPEYPVTVEQGTIPDEIFRYSSFDFEYNSKQYKIGLGNDSGSNTLHIDSGSVINLKDDRPGCGGELLIGELQTGGDENTYLPASTEIYNLFSNISFKVVAEDTTGITATRTSKKVLGVLANSINVQDSSSIVTKAMIEISFTYNGELHTIKFEIIIKNTVDIEKNNISIEEFVSSNFNDKTSFEALIGETLTEPSNTRVTINLDGTKTYNSVNITYGKELDSLIINGNGATIKGTLSSANAVTEITNIKFDNTGGNVYAKGLVADNPTSGPANDGSITKVEDCSFTNYKYGVYSKDNTLISGIRNCQFNNCETGIYINSYGGSSYSDYKDDSFFNCATAIDLVQIPEYCTPYQFVMKYMTFITELSLTPSYDYDVHCNGNFFFTNNFYGGYNEEYKPNPTTNDIDPRSASIKYHTNDRTKSKVYTNPCIRGNNRTDIGIDPNPNLYTAIFFSNSGQNMLPLSDLLEGVNLDICENGSGNQLASLKFEEAE